MPSADAWQMAPMLTMKTCDQLRRGLIFVLWAFKSSQISVACLWLYVVLRTCSWPGFQFHQGRRSFKDWMRPQSDDAVYPASKLILSCHAEDCKASRSCAMGGLSRALLRQTSQ